MKGRLNCRPAEVRYLTDGTSFESHAIFVILYLKMKSRHQNHEAFTVFFSYLISAQRATRTARKCVSRQTVTECKVSMQGTMAPKRNNPSEQDQRIWEANI
jgi:hypothetical protein